MQKKLIAIAIAGLSSAAFAQTNVTLYGVADLSVESVKASGGTQAATGGAQDYSSQGRVTSDSSYVGFKGKEDLGNGLTAMFQFETTVTADTGGWGGGRDTFLGLSSNDFGTVKLGNLTGPTRSIGNRMEMLPGNTGVGDAVSLLGNIQNVANTANSGVFDTRFSNAALYESKDYNGLSFAALVAFGENQALNSNPNNQQNASFTTAGSTQSANNSRIYDLSVTYMTGAWDLAYGHGHLTSGTNWDNQTLPVPPVLPTLANINNDRLGVGYSFEGGHKVTFQADRESVNAVAAGQLTQDSYSLQGKYAVTANGSLVADYSIAKDISADGGSFNDSGAKLFTLGYIQNLSKRTLVKAVYTRISNDTNAAYNFSYAGVGSTGATGFGPGSDPAALSVGMRHSF